MMSRRRREGAGGISLNNYKVQSVDVSVSVVQLRVGADQLKDNECTADEMLSQDVSVSRLRVGVDQLKDNVCTADDMLSQDENIVDGQTSGGQYVCTVSTL